MIKTKYIMYCGCRLVFSDLVVYNSSLSCPKHKKRVRKVHKLCKRCAQFVALPMASSNKTCCDKCIRILDQARAVQSPHTALTFIDPFLMRKTIIKNIEDISINAMVGYEAIQIESPRETQRENKKVAIDINIKTKTLLSMKKKGDAMIKDCRTCIKLNKCERPTECSKDGEFPYWEGKITGKIIKTQKNKIFIKNDIDNFIYAADKFAQITPGFFHIKQQSPVTEVAA